MSGINLVPSMMVVVHYFEKRSTLVSTVISGSVFHYRKSIFLTEPMGHPAIVLHVDL